MYAEHEAATAQTTSDPMSRRHFLWKNGVGLGGLALTWMLQREAAANGDGSVTEGLHFPARAKRVVQIFCMGGMSQMDTFDHKPDIAKHAGKRPSLVNRKSLRNTKNGLMVSPFGFQRYGECGKMVSDIFPNVGELVDDLCFIHSCHTDIPEHAGAILMMTLGALQPNRPSMGSWLTDGLGTENQDLPGFVAMSPRAQPRGKLANWGSSFLPGAHAGTYVNIAST